jgi:photosystem II stability/assembly factor-like uncharacterized protein
VSIVLATFVVATTCWAAGKEKGAKTDDGKGKLDGSTFSGLAWRPIGPALTSGRIGDVAIVPSNRSTWYVAASSGGVWKTTNAGTTWTSIFDDQGSYSIGCVTIDPKDPLVVWVGTGENNSQRSVGYGDGVYRSVDGGKSWEKRGLEKSEHVAKIVVDPRDSKVVWVAAQGPLWKSGGERGLYRSTDGGSGWKRMLEVDADTGVTDFVVDPRNPDVLVAATYQRRRHVWTLVDGGPGSALHKSTDGGATWKKLENGLPKGEIGRIGLAVPPAEPSWIYAVVEAAGKEGGFYRSTDFGASWEKRSDKVCGSPQYYQRLVADPKNPERVYLLDTLLQVTTDGGKSFSHVPERAKHVDDHALWIDPDDPAHLVNGCDGGLYESRDRGETWDFRGNLPVTQFYKVAVDQALPFYNVYGGTQDNFSLGGPSRTITTNGIRNSDWFVTVGGDGFQTQVDPTNPDIVYSQYQNGGLVRFDRKSGEIVDVQPWPEDDLPLRWNWDSPLLISPHSPTRLWFGANRLFRSDDRGDSWRAVGPDLTRQIDRNRLPVMGRVRSVDSVAKNASTAFYGNIFSIAESPKVEGLLYVGTDDGLVQVSENGGTSWRKVESFPGVPKESVVADLVASTHDADVVYAAFDNHQMGDFAPYVLTSRDRGKSWTKITGELPERGTVYCLAEDPVKRELLFAGTEFGVFVSLDGGRKWVKLSGGMPTVAVRDLVIQARESDLVAGTFGRGIWVLDDYSSLRSFTTATLEEEGLTPFPVRKAPMFVPWSPLGGKSSAWQGDSFFVAPNPPQGAILTWHLGKALETRKKLRETAEAERAKKGEDTPYPSWDALRAEDVEEEPAIVVTISDEEGKVVRRLEGPAGAGFGRLAWDLRFPPPVPATQELPASDEGDPPVGPLAAPGTYWVSFEKRIDGTRSPVGSPVSFVAAPVLSPSLPETDRKALAGFHREVARLERATLGAAESLGETKHRIEMLRKAVDGAPAASAKLAADVRGLEARRRALATELHGDDTLRSRNEPSAPSILERIESVAASCWLSTSAPTATQRKNVELAGRRLETLLGALRALVGTDLPKLEAEAEAAGAPWSPGRVPELGKE